MYKNFIQKIFQKDIAVLKSDDEVKARIENISWPSECSADLGPYTVGECGRSLFYKILGVKPSNMSVRGAYICDAGLMFEKYHIERLKTSDMLKDEQFRVVFETETTNKVVITGKVDCVIEDDNKRKFIEIKSVSAFKAPEIFGQNGKMPLPSASNLMQAMMYKHWTITEEGQKAQIDEVFLQYVNRSDGSTFYYRVDLDPQGYAIITAIDQAGQELYTMKLQDQKSFDDLMTEGQEDTELARLAELRISTSDIFKKFDEVYTCARAKTLPPKDFKNVYSQEDLERAAKCGKISKRKLTTLKKSGETYSDYKCTICNYMKKCLADSGVNLINF